MKKQLTKKDLKKMITKDYLLGKDPDADDRICVVEYILNPKSTKNCKMYKYNLNRDSFKVDSFSTCTGYEYRCKFTKNNTRTTFDYSVSHNITTPQQCSNKLIVSFESNCDIEEVEEICENHRNMSIAYNETMIDKEVLVNIVFHRVYMPPIIRVFEFNDPIEQKGTETLIGINYLAGERLKPNIKLLYSSTDADIYTKITKTTTTQIKCTMLSLKNAIEERYTSSSISRETIKYNEKGNVVNYKNPSSGISMTVSELDDDISLEQVFFEDEPIFWRKVVRNKDGSVSVSTSFDNDGLDGNYHWERTVYGKSVHYNLDRKDMAGIPLFSIVVEYRSNKRNISDISSISISGYSLDNDTHKLERIIRTLINVEANYTTIGFSSISNLSSVFVMDTKFLDFIANKNIKLNSYCDNDYVCNSLTGDMTYLGKPCDEVYVRDIFGIPRKLDKENNTILYY